MSIHNNIKTLREDHLKISQSEFADKIGIKRNSVSLIETNKRNPSERTISDICDVFNVNIDWLRNGNEPIFKEKTSNNHFAYFISQIGVSDDENLKDAIYKMSKLNAKNKKIAEKMIDLLLEEQ